MSGDPEHAPNRPGVPPVSSFAGPLGELMGARLLGPPNRPGVAASLGRFEVLQVIGAGGMGIVLLARDPQSGKRVAIKLLRPEIAFDEAMVRRFLREAGHMEKFKHPNVVPVVELSSASPGPYFVMPYFEAGNLTKWIRPGGIMQREVVLGIALHMAEGLLYAHRRGIIHRDVKPANILIGGDLNAYVADFGLARTLFNDTVIDEEGHHFEGTIAYASPAVAAGLAEDTRCDIYSFGAVLYEMLTGEPPYSGSSVGEIRSRIRHGPPPPILTLNPNADRELAHIAEGAMGRELRDRYADMADVVADLHRVADNRAAIVPRGTRLHLLRRVSFSAQKAGLRWAVAALSGACLLGAAIWVLHGGGGGQMEEAVTAPSPPASPAPDILPILFSQASGIATDGAGDVFIAEPDRHAILRIGLDGSRSVWAGDPGAGFSLLRGLAAGENGALFVADGWTLRRVNSSGRVSVVAGRAGLPGYADGFREAARFQNPSGVAVGPDGFVYVADAYAIRRVSPNGEVRTLAGRVGHSGGNDGPGPFARFSDQRKGLAVDREGAVYVADMLNCTIREIGRTGSVVTLAGLPRVKGSDDGRGSAARFDRPEAVAVDSDGYLYVADTGNDTIRKITPAGWVSTLAGCVGQAGERDGNGTDARFDRPSELAFDGRGNLWVADAGGHRLRIVRANGEVETPRGQTPVADH